jgi:glycosyltransferase involved in cell wall biosynthesis
MNSVSVIVPTLNRPALVLEAVESAVRQTRAPLEVLVVDDGSNPPVDADDLLARFGPMVRVLRNARSEGLAWARHQGVEAARGDYVVHLDDDDLFSKNLVEECVAALDADPSIELVFIGTEGFGRSAAHFNRVHPAGTARVVEQGGGTVWRDGVHLFGPDLIHGLLNQVPMPFQRVMVRREVWHKVSRLRLAAYLAALGLECPEAARDRVRGTLRDSEWALYSALACRKTALIDRPLYLQRCDGQGGSSQAAMRQKHMHQGIEIRSVLARASDHLPELRAFHQEIAKNLARSHFDAAYELMGLGQYAQSLHHLGVSFRLGPNFKAAKLLLKLGVAWLSPQRAP